MRAHTALLLAGIAGPAFGTAGAPASAQAPLGPTVMGKIVWPGHDLSQGQVRVFGDKGLSKLVDQFGTGGAGGTFVLIVPAGEYYLMAVVDSNANGEMDEGDGLGFYGVTEFGGEGQEPEPLKVAEDALIGDVRIYVSATMTLGEDGRPKAKPIPVVIEGDVPPTGVPASVGGTVQGGDKLPAPLFLMVLSADDHRPALASRLAPDTADFGFAVEAGAYHLLAVADASQDGLLGAGDRVGAYGVEDWADPPPELPPLNLNAGDEIGGIQVFLIGQLGEDGVVGPPEGTGSFQLAIDTLPGIVSGTVVHPGAGLKPAQVRLSSDPGMSQPIASVECEPGPGTFVSHVDPGTYYLTAIVDENGDGRFGPGDGVGFYGVDDLTAAQAPAPVTVRHGSLMVGLDIHIIARVTEDGKLAPIAPNEPPEETQD